MQRLADVLLGLDKGFKKNLTFQAELEKLLAIQSATHTSYEPGSGSDGLILTIIMQMANFANKHI